MTGIAMVIGLGAVFGWGLARLIDWDVARRQKLIREQDAALCSAMLGALTCQRCGAKWLVVHTSGGAWQCAECEHVHEVVPS